MMDDNAAQTNGVSDPFQELNDILKGGVKVEKSFKSQESKVINASKLSNKFVRGYVGRLRKLGKYSDTQILNLVLNLDEKVEEKKITQGTLDNLKNKNN